MSPTRPTLALALLLFAGAAGARACEREAFRVVIDVGHTAEIPGAMSARGVPEYEYNLKLSRRIEETLVGAGFRSTHLLVTRGASLASLIRRVGQANGVPAHLFVSVHHDSVPARFLETWDHEGVARPYSDRFKGHSLFVSADSRHYRASLRFASLLGSELKARGLAYAAHYAEPFMRERRRQLVDAQAGVYRFDELHVLRRTGMPAVLLEAGSIINRDEELAMRSPERQAAIATAVTRAVEGFCGAGASQRNARYPS